ncbi:hypothetical protein [Paraburkholderia sp. BL6669N2]|uniref:hypothetical protein n=1 Tax=Paraburkholderia sp. BL6669N2 TaxID=1938807 RepID=UPI0011C036B3|nr:hypothetical protein [Paraburkholderia sp. BL6669N2]
MPDQLLHGLLPCLVFGLPGQADQSMRSDLARKMNCKPAAEKLEKLERVIALVAPTNAVDFNRGILEAASPACHLHLAMNRFIRSPMLNELIQSR